MFRAIDERQTPSASRSGADWIGRHVNALNFVGGVPRQTDCATTSRSGSPDRLRSRRSFDREGTVGEVSKIDDHNGALRDASEAISAWPEKWVHVNGVLRIDVMVAEPEWLTWTRELQA